MPDTIPVDPEALRAVDAFGGSGGERNARAYAVAAHVFLARRPA